MNDRHIDLVACLHAHELGHALIYARVESTFYRLSKQINQPLEYIQMSSRDECVTDARNITRYSPRYLHFDSINNAPLNQLQLERMVLSLQAMGHLNNGQQQRQA